MGVLSKSERCGGASSFDTVQPFVTSVHDPMLSSVPPWSNHYHHQNHYQCEVSTDQYLFHTSGNDSTSRKIYSEKVKSDSSLSINDKENESNKEYKTYSFLQQMNEKLIVFCENLLSRLHKVQH